ncbi:MAG: winged helix-turn-helix domain-containing protein [Halobacteriovoraceae bacterium]|nr:winged helix-turn-helix domain-containing protein [Halobacteriovoraceae bacterium]
MLLIFTSPLKANNGVVLYDSEGKIRTINQAFRDLYGLDDDRMTTMGKSCQFHFSPLSGTENLLRGFSVMDLFNEPKIKTLIRDILIKRERNKVRMNLNGVMTEIISSYKGTYDSLFIGSLVFRNVDPAFINLEMEKDSALDSALGMSLDDGPSITYNKLSIKPEVQKVIVNGKIINTLLKEFRLMHFLIKRPNEIFTPYQVLEVINVDAIKTEEDQLDEFIFALKEKLGEAGDYIQIIPDEGIYFKTENAGKGIRQRKIKLHELEIDINNRRVFEAGGEAILEDIEFDTLLLMVRASGNTLTLQQIIHSIQKENPEDISIMTVNRTILSLKKKLPKTSRFIHTVSSEGYRLETDVSNHVPYGKMASYYSLLINPQTYEVFKNGDKMATNRTEAEILLHLIRNQNTIVSESQIAQNIYDGKYDISDREIFVNIISLRKKLQERGKVNIQIIPKKGYRLQIGNLEDDEIREIVDLGSVVFDPYNFVIFIEDEKLDLSGRPLSFKTLYLTGKNNGEIMPYSQLLKDLKGEHANLTEELIYHHIKNLTTKKPLLNNYVQIIKGRGLRWSTDIKREIIHIDEVSLRPSDFSVSIKGEENALGYLQFDVIYFLAQNPGKVFDPSQILEGIYGEDHGFSGNVIHNRIYRMKTNHPHLRNYIQTVPKIGYVFKTEHTQEVIILPNLKINPHLLEITVHDQTSTIPYMEMQVLDLLASNPTEGFSIEQISLYLYGPINTYNLKTIQNYISSLREKIGSEYQIIYTTNRYRFQATKFGVTSIGKDVITLQNLKVDPNSNKVLVDNEEVDTSFIEFDILHLLAQYPEEVFTYTQIKNHVHGQNEDIDDNVITTRIYSLREILKNAICYIQTINGNGTEETGYLLSNKKIIYFPEFDIVIDPNRLYIAVRDNKATLRYKPFKLFYFLQQNSNTIITLDQITEGTGIGKHMIRTYVHQVRSALQKIGLKGCIETIHGQGLLFNPSCFQQ